MSGSNSSNSPSGSGFTPHSSFIQTTLPLSFTNSSDNYQTDSCSSSSISPSVRSEKSLATKGRKKTAIWNHFTPFNNRAICVYCNKTVKARAGDSMKSHLISCLSAKKAHVDLIQLFPELKDKREGKQLQIESHLLTFKKEIADDKLARFMFTSGSTFNTLDNEEFIDYSSYLQPLYRPFSRTTFTQSILYDHLILYEAELQEALSNSSGVTLSIDGWSTAKKESLYGVVATLEDGTEYLVDAILLGSESASADNLFRSLDSIISRIGHKNIIAIASDGARNMSSLKRMVSVHYPNIIGVTCFVHSLNLLCISIFKNEYMTEIFSKVSRIIESFARSNKLTSKLKEAQQGLPVNIGLAPLAGTRFSSCYKCVYNLYANEDAVKSVSRDVDLKSDLKSSIEDDLFWTNLKDIVNIFEPLDTAIKLCESSTLRLSDVFYYICKISLSVVISMRDRMCVLATKIEASTSDAILNMMEKYLTNPLLHLITILDCKYSVEFSSCTIELVRDYLKTHLINRGANISLVERCVADFDKFINNKEKCTGISSTSFWDRNATYPSLWPLALSFFKIVGNSMSCERTFSKMGWISALRRGSMTTQNLIAFIKVNSHYKNIKTKREERNMKDLRVVLELIDDSIKERLDINNQPLNTNIPIETISLLKAIHGIFASNVALKNFIDKRETIDENSNDITDLEMMQLLY